MPTVVTAGAREAVRKDAAFQVFAKRLADVGAWCVVIALAVRIDPPRQQKARTGEGSGFAGKLGLRAYLRAGGTSVQLPCATSAAMLVNAC